MPEKESSAGCFAAIGRVVVCAILIWIILTVGGFIGAQL